MFTRTMAMTLFSLSLLGAWQWAGASGRISPLIIATPTQTVAAIVDNWRALASAFAITAYSILVTIILTWTAGVAAGLWVGTGELRSMALSPILSSLFAIPLMVWYPLFVAWFGIGISSKVALGFFGGVFPIALSGIAGAKMFEARYVHYCYSIGATRPQIFMKVLLPLAFPSIAAGLRIGTSIIVICVIFGEMVASTGGIGYWIAYNQALFNTPRVYAGIALSLLCVGAVDLILTKIERRFRPWQ